MTRIQNCLSIIIAVTLFSGCETDEPKQQATMPVAEDVAEVQVVEEAESTQEAPVNPSTGELLPMPFSVIWAPWKGDYEGMIERRDEATDLGGTMRLGAQEVRLRKGSLIRALYGRDIIEERHRHRYEFNNTYMDVLQDAGLAIAG